MVVVERDGQVIEGRGHLLLAEPEPLEQVAHGRLFDPAVVEPERWVVLDTTLPVEALAERVWAGVSERLKVGE